jgi:arginine transport system substrate-binding protein
MINFFSSIKKAIILISLFCLTSFAFAESKPILRFATEATYPPFEYVDASGEIEGFDIEIATALCEQMKVHCSFSNQSFNSLIPSLTLGKYDALIAALGATPERQTQVSFTHPYYEPSASFVGLIDKHEDINHLNGKVVGVQQGSTFESYLYHHYDNKIVIKAYASVQDALMDLNSERLDMVIADTPIMQAWLKQNDNNKRYGIINHPIIDHTYFGNGYAIAVSKKNPLLLQALNKALAAIKSNGIYNQISQHYFGSKQEK